jgi:hypothetical protein
VQEPALRNLYEEASPINLEEKTEKPETPPLENVLPSTPTPTPSTNLRYPSLEP